VAAVFFDRNAETRRHDTFNFLEEIMLAQEGE
jgi:hypothetical protein